MASLNETDLELSDSATTQPYLQFLGNALVTNKKEKRRLRAPQAALPLAEQTPTSQVPAPDFLALLNRPLVKLDLPSDFDAPLEASHLEALWYGASDLQRYHIEAFVHAGGSGMVFKAIPPDDGPAVALKIARAALFRSDSHHPNAPTSLSPVAPQELRALETLSHRHIVRLKAALSNTRGVFAIATTFVEDPKPLDKYLADTLDKHPDPRGKKGLSPFSPERLDRACAFLVTRFTEMAEALVHMHENKRFHCDIKQANILIDSKQHAILTDLGASVHQEDADKNGNLRIQFTWTYAHPNLTDLISQPKGISGGGLKASAEVNVSDLTRFDLFAFGRTIQEALAHLVDEFGERCYASYNFRFLHLLSALLLDGHVAPLTERLRQKDGHHFVKDVALDYPVELFAVKKIVTASDLLTRLRRFSYSTWPYEEVPELNKWHPEMINTGISGAPASFSQRVAAIFNHGSMRRLRSELQLGWVREIYPGAYHSRWSHSLGVFSAAAEYYAALLADPEVPTARVLLNPADVEHALVAAMLHDIGQTAFGHDLEDAAPALYRHEKLIGRLLDENAWGTPTLRSVLKQFWPRVDLQRVLRILGFEGELHNKGGTGDFSDPVDGLAHDIIDGPIDADKLDYLARDSASCGVPYGEGIDHERFLRALTIDVKLVGGAPRLALAYRAKGAAAVESVLLTRYQMYGAVYWHHTFRCIQAMFSHAAASQLSSIKDETIKIENAIVPSKSLQEFFYYRVVCGMSNEICKAKLRGKGLPVHFFTEVPTIALTERALEFVWKCGDSRTRDLVERLASRRLFKRVFELRTGDLGEHGDYSALAAALSPTQRIDLAAVVSDRLLDAIHKKMQQRGPIESTSEHSARKRHGELLKSTGPLAVIDFPIRGIPEERNFPRAIGDPARKYIAGRGGETASGRSVFHTVRHLQVNIAALRIFALPELHELIVRYLDPQDVQECVESAIPIIRIQQ